MVNKMTDGTAMYYCRLPFSLVNCSSLDCTKETIATCDFFFLERKNYHFFAPYHENLRSGIVAARTGCFTLQKESPQPTEARSVWATCRSASFGEAKGFVALSGMEPRSLDLLASVLVPIQSELSICYSLTAWKTMYSI